MSLSTGRSIWLAVGVFLATMAFVPAQPAEAREGTKTLKLYFGHTKERGEFTFKRNGRFDRGEIQKINRFLRDWRRNEPANMDPQLFDLIWSIYKQTGSKEYIHIVSAYRSLKTNNMLRSRSKGVAEKSQHTAGKAMDFYIPGVPLAKLRAIAMKHQGGGVGFYPTSGSPFVHVDTGNVRSWPRMSRKQLIALFPNGETLYLPADGKPLQGYEKAMARRKSSGATALAYVDTGGNDDAAGGRKSTVGGWLKRVFDGGADEAEDNEASGTAAAPAPAPVPVPAAPAPKAPEAPAAAPQVLIAEAKDIPDPRLPRPRPGVEAGIMADALTPALPAVAQAAPVEVASLPAPAPSELDAINALTLAPLPRTRPDATQIAALPASAPAGDALAALAAGGEVVPQPLAEKARQARLELAFAAAEREPAEPSASMPSADSERIASLASASSTGPAAERPQDALAAANALAGADAARMPRPRPLAVAFAGSGLPLADMPVRPAVPAVPSPAATASTSDASNAGLPKPIAAQQTPIAEETGELVLASAPAQPDIAALIAEEPRPAAATLNEERTKAEARFRRAAITAELNGETFSFSLPHPRDDADLFKAPATASKIGVLGQHPQLASGRFQTAKRAEPARGSFLSKLFGNLTQ